MDRKLQKLILEVIRVHNGIAEWKLIKNKVELNYWDRSKIPENSGTIIKHQLDLMEKEEKVLRKDETPVLPHIYYILLPAGHRIFDPTYKRLWFFVLYDKHNLFIVLSLFVSIFSLAVSFIALRF